MITRAEARMIAQELYKLMKAESAVEDYLTTKSAAEYLGVSISFIRHNIDDIPHTKKGRMLRFAKSDLSRFIDNQPL